MNGQLDQLAKAIVLPRPAPRATPWIAVAGAKGGVGKTTLAVNLAVLLARAGYRTLLADLDPGCGDVGVHLRLAGRRDLDDAAAGDCALREAIVDGPGGIAVLLGRSGSTRLAAHEPVAIETTLLQLGEVAADFDVVVADTGAGIGPATTAVARRADVVLAVTTPDAAALTDTYALTKVLRGLGRPAPRLVVNRVRSRDEAARTAAKLTAATQQLLGAPTALCGFVRSDARLERSVADQRPLCLSGLGEAAEDLRGLCATVLAEIPDTRRRALPQKARRLRPAR